MKGAEEDADDREIETQEDEGSRDTLLQQLGSA